MTLIEKRKLIGAWLREEGGQELWDLLCGLRGPDAPSERVDMTPAAIRSAYQGRRARKFKTVEVIRHKAFFGVIGGGARHHDDDHILLPPTAEWDHFDRHADRAARVVGLTVQIEEPVPTRLTRVTVEKKVEKKVTGAGGGKEVPDGPKWVGFPHTTMFIYPTHTISTVNADVEIFSVEELTEEDT